MSKVPPNLLAAFEASQKNNLSMAPKAHAQTDTGSVDAPEELAVEKSQPQPASQESEQASAVKPVQQTASSVVKKEAPKNPAVSSVDINIAGTYHRIVCPTDEVKNLEEATSFINDKIHQLRQAIRSRSPNNEELLVLVCLELYDQHKTVKDGERQRILEQEDSLNLIHKLTKDIKDIL